jgi:hypothetical protein
MRYALAAAGMAAGAPYFLAGNIFTGVGPHPHALGSRLPPLADAIAPATRYALAAAGMAAGAPYFLAGNIFTGVGPHPHALGSRLPPLADAIAPATRYALAAAGMAAGAPYFLAGTSSHARRRLAPALSSQTANRVFNQGGKLAVC